MVNVNSDPEVTGGHHCVRPTQKVPFVTARTLHQLLQHFPLHQTETTPELGTGRVKCALVGWEPQVCEALTSRVEITEGVGTG